MNVSKFNMPKLDAFLKWIAKAPRRKTTAYYVGALMYDRCRGMHPGYAEVDAIGNAAWDAYLAGHVQLSQKKIGRFKYEYRATML